MSGVFLGFVVWFFIGSRFWINFLGKLEQIKLPRQETAVNGRKVPIHKGLSFSHLLEKLFYFYTCAFVLKDIIYCNNKQDTLVSGNSCKGLWSSGVERATSFLQQPARTAASPAQSQTTVSSLGSSQSKSPRNPCSKHCLTNSSDESPTKATYYLNFCPRFHLFPSSWQLPRLCNGTKLTFFFRGRETLGGGRKFKPSSCVKGTTAVGRLMGDHKQQTLDVPWPWVSE